jgi:CBS domain-containing protein
MNLQKLWASHGLTAIQDVREFMTENPYVIEPTTSIRTAVELMLAHKIGGLPVMEEDELIGIITESDIFRFLLASLPLETLQCEQQFPLPE